MLYKYDEAICEDLEKSLSGMSSPIRVIKPESAVNIVSQIQDDKVKFPLIVLTRTDDSGTTDESRLNFTMAHSGVSTLFVTETNMIYSERVIPIRLGYDLTILATNTVDMDELMRELRFKYINQYFLTLKVPYESKRQIRFGITQVPGQDTVSIESGSVEYLNNGTLYQAIIHFTCQGAVLLTYVPQRKLDRVELDTMIKICNAKVPAKPNKK